MLPDCNLVDSDGTLKNKGYLMAQFSKFIRPGSYRISATYQPQNNVNVQAFKGEKNVIVALNRNNFPSPQTFTIVKGRFDNVRKYTTSNSKKLADDGTVTVTDHTFTVSLEPQSVTTFAADGV